MDLITPAIIVNGCKNTRVGFAGKEAPMCKFESVVGRPRHRITCMIGIGFRDAYVGDEAISKRGILHNRYPINCERIENYDDLEKIWYHSFYEQLKIAPEEHPSCIYFSNSNKEEYEKTTQIMFETFNVPSLYIANPSVALNAVGKDTGIVYFSGGNSTFSVPVYQGCLIKSGEIKYNFGGNNISEYLVKLLTQKGYIFETTKEKMVIETMKQKHSFLSLDLERDIESSKNKSKPEISFTLPDDTVIHIAQEIFCCTESIFEPSLVDKPFMKPQEMIHYSASQIEPSLVKDFLENIVVCGGNTLIPNFKERLQKGLNSIGSSNFEKNIVKTEIESSELMFKGCSLISSLKTFEKSSLTKDEYDEYGPVQSCKFI